MDLLSVGSGKLEYAPVSSRNGNILLFKHNDWLIPNWITSPNKKFYNQDDVLEFLSLHALRTTKAQKNIMATIESKLIFFITKV